MSQIMIFKNITFNWGVISNANEKSRKETTKPKIPKEFSMNV